MKATLPSMWEEKSLSHFPVLQSVLNFQFSMFLFLLSKEMNKTSGFQNMYNL